MSMRSIACTILVAALAGGLAAQAQTNVYRWVDKDGKVHFSDTPPPPDAKSSSQKRMGGGYVDDSQLPYATQVAAKRNPVTLYTANNCAAPCERGRDLLARRGIPFHERNAQGSTADAEELRKLAGALEVPLLVIGQRKVRGYDEDSWHAALDEAGYPRTPLPGQLARVPSPPATPAQPAPSGQAEASDSSPPGK